MSEPTVPSGDDGQPAASTSPLTSGVTPHKVRRAIGPKLRKLLYVVFALLALLGANSGYLASITALEWLTGATYQNYFYFLMFLGHLVLGLILLAPFLVFGVIHMRNSRGRRNRRAIRVGYALFIASCGVLLTGLLLVRVEGVIDLRHPSTRSVVYWLHVGLPLAGAWLYWLHRLVGPKIKWKVGLTYGAVVAATIAAMAGLHSSDPRSWNVAGPEDGDNYFKPSLARTATGNFIPAKSLMNDQYCLKCHADIHKDWKQSAHHNSSFSNPAYLVSIRETRDVTLKRDGNVQASRWCAGCHDPAPFFSGAFDKPDFDVVNDPTADAGVTCTVCHAITNVNSNRGNADYTIEEPLHYPFAFSDSSMLQWVNEQLIKAKPGFHKKTFLKPFHKTAEFCSTCHKVSLPFELNHYKEFLRGQNHYDPYLLSGVSGHGARSFYYPPVAQENCNGCHMPALASSDFGARVLDESGELKIHDHLFPGANTAVPWWNGDEDAIRRQQEFLAGTMRVDIFGIRDNSQVIDGELTAPLRPDVPTLQSGGSYLLETVIRTVKLGHLFTQGTVDSNEVWLEVKVVSGDRVLGHSGAIDERSEVDLGAHRVSVFLLDREGNRINRRNPQDIFTPLYNHQIPPGAGQTVHYGIVLPEELDAPVTVELKLHYRKFDREFVEEFVSGKSQPGDRPIRGFERGKPYGNPLPITTLAVDRVTFPVEGVDVAVTNSPRDDIPEWQRWNDYGIGTFLKGKSELASAQHAFRQVERLGRYDGPLNLARALNAEGDVDGAVEATSRAAKFDDPPAPPWTLSWLSGVLNRQQNRLKEAEENLRATLEMRTAETVRRKFDFSLDYMVRNQLASVLYDRSRQIRIPTEVPEDADARKRYEQRRKLRDGFLRAAAHELDKTLEVDSENLTAHYLLLQIYEELGEVELSKKHARLHERYRPDDSAQGEATRLARLKYPDAGLAAEKVAIYQLRPPSGVSTSD